MLLVANRNALEELATKGNTTKPVLKAVGIYNICSLFYVELLLCPVPSRPTNRPHHSSASEIRRIEELGIGILELHINESLAQAL